jgi:hypothetical protein
MFSIYHMVLSKITLNNTYLKMQFDMLVMSDQGLRYQITQIWIWLKYHLSHIDEAVHRKEA